jgi:DNA/RNA endonuclease YhcR with UshA esterase domain
VITTIDTEWSEQYGNITVTIQVGDNAEQPIQCFRLKGDGAADLKVGDTITVTGMIKNYQGKIQFNAGCTLG